MAWDHPLGPNSNAKQFDGTVRVEEHPYCQPGRAVTMDRGNYNNCDADESFECEGIDG